MLTPTWATEATFPEAAALPTATPALLADIGRTAGARALVVDGTARLDSAALLSAVAGRQARLRAAGVRRGDVVGVQLPNWWETVATIHALWGMGAVVCPVPVNFRVAELARIFTACDLAAIVAPARYRGTDHPELIRAAAARTGADVPILTVRDPEAAGPPAAGPAAPELDAGLDDVCLLMFTSGTTGTPKGVLHSHRTLLVESWSIARLFRLDGDRIYMPSPLGHITGLLYGVVMPLLIGGSVALQAEWDAAAGVDIIESGGCTFSVGATPFLRGLCDEYARRGGASSLTGFVCGGADVPPALVRRAAEVLDAVVVRAYGLTEMPTVTCGGPDDPDRIREETDGRLTGSSQARLADPVDGVGELEVRGPELCLGYLDPAHTAESFTADGWFRTGDLATISPDGGITIAGRAKDIIVRGGENISVKEVEDYLLEHPAVGDVAIVGVPDDTLGERACAFVVPAEAAPPPTLRELTAFLLGYEIAKHKLPEYLLVTDRLPRTESGKIQKFRLRETAVRELRAGRGERR